MTRLLVHVEGETEETFVNEVIAPHLYGYGYHSVSARLIGNARLRLRRGGIRGWSTVREDIVRHLKQDSGCLATTMVDYYGLPQSGPSAWPGREDASSKQYSLKAESVQGAMLTDVSNALGGGESSQRFCPYVVMHEFEGLLFSDCARFASGIGMPELECDFQAIRDSFSNPEEINDSLTTAPSKRVVSLLPKYQKVIMGNLAALSIGLDTIRQECPRFEEWIKFLENWPN